MITTGSTALDVRMASSDKCASQGTSDTPNARTQVIGAIKSCPAAQQTYYTSNQPCKYPVTGIGHQRQCQHTHTRHRHIILQYNQLIERASNTTVHENTFGFQESAHSNSAPSPSNASRSLISSIITTPSDLRRATAISIRCTKTNPRVLRNIIYYRTRRVTALDI